MKPSKNGGSIWKELCRKFRKKRTRSKQRSDRELLEEVLTIVRQLSRETSSTFNNFVIYLAFARSALESPTPLESEEMTTPKQEALREIWKKLPARIL